MIDSLINLSSLILFIALGMFFYSRKKIKSVSHEEKDADTWRKYRKFSLIAMLIAVVLIAVLSPHKSSRNITTKNLPETTSSTVTETEPVKTSPTLKIKPEEFQQRFNQVMHTDIGEMGASGAFDIGSPQIQPGTKRDFVKYSYNGFNVTLTEYVDKNTGAIQEIAILVPINNDTGKDAVLADMTAAILIFTASIEATDVSFKEGDAADIYEKLGMNLPAEEWVKNTETSRKGMKYSKKVIPKTGFEFSIVAE